MMLLALWLLAAPGCVPIEGEHTLARDLVSVGPVFAAIPGDTAMGYAPAPGAQRKWLVPELRRVARRYAPQGTATGELHEICTIRATEPLASDKLQAAIAAAVGNPEARIQLIDWSRYPAPHGEIEFSRAGLTRGAAEPVTWRGYVKYGAGRRFAIWARVRVSALIP